MPDLQGWLRQFGLQSLAGVLAENDVDLEILPDLTEQDFEKLGISLGNRRKLLKAIATLQDSSNTASKTAETMPPRSATAAPSAEAERRQITVLFSDLVGSTALATALDPEDLSRLIKRYQDACAGAIARFDSYVAKFMGDGVLAYFGYPQAHEDAAERSVRAALAIVDAVRSVERADGCRLETRVGIATGLVVVGDIIGSGAAREEAIVGETPNLAARLQSLAEPNTVLVSDATCRLLGRVFDCESHGEHALKGFAKPVTVWRVLREASVASRFAARTGLGPFAGRVQEMGLLLERWHLAQQSEGQAIVLTAEAGMGKSRLVEAFFDRIGEGSHRRVVTQCSPYHSNTALYPLMRQIELAADFVVNDSPEQKLDKLEAWLTAAGTPIQPTAFLLADLLSLPAASRYPPLELTPAQRKNATVSALVNRLLHISEHEPVLFVLEDAQWIDATTLEFLTRLIDSIPSARILIIVTARQEFASPWSGRDHVTALALGRLGKAQCAEIVAGIAAAQSITHELVEEILAKTDGVPLFVEELTRTIAESPTPNRLAVPSTLQDSLMARLDRLGPAKEIAQIAAAIGRQFAQALLAAVAPVRADELDTALVRLTEARLVFPQARAIEPTYTFKHALTRDVAYDSLLRARRQQLHERIARTIEQRFPALAETEPEILAHHFSRADLPAQDCLYSERAGDRAVAHSTYAEAVAHFSAALAEAGRMPPGRERDQRELAISLKYGPAIIVFKGHRNPEIETVYQRACDIARSLNDDRALFKALWGLWLSAGLGRRTDNARIRAEELVALAERSGDEALYLEAIHCRWSTAHFRGDVARALADAREGIRQYNAERHSKLGAEFGGHDPGVCAYAVAASSLAELGKAREATQHLEQAFALADRLNQPPAVLHATLNALQTYQIMGDRAAVSRTALRMGQLAEKFNLPLQRSIAIFMAGASGDQLAAGLQAMEAEFPRVSAIAPLPEFYAALLAGARLAAGLPARALEPLDGILSAVKEPGAGFYLPEIHRLRGECLLQIDGGKFDEAQGEFETAIAIAKHQQGHVFRLRAAISLARACSVAGLPERGLAPLRAAIDVFDAPDDVADLAAARQLVAALAR